MQRYGHGGDIYGNLEIQLDFSVNTNPFGMPDAVRDALVARVDDYANYPDPLCRELRSAIATHENVQREWVLCGNGAADLIYRLCFALKPRRALVCAPTFSEYEKALEQVGTEVIYHGLSAENGFDITGDLPDMISPDLDMLFLCHPNNPTGRLISDDIMERVMKKVRQTKTVAVVDECFLDFTKGRSAGRFLAEIPELCILKAFTKMYAMAGLRLGYMLTSDKTLLQKVSAAAQCWSVSVPSQIAGVAALACGDWREKTLSLVGKERQFVSDRLEDLGITVFPSDANYLLLQSAHTLHEPLLQKGMLIRPCGNFTGLDSSFYRIGIKTNEKNIRLLQAIGGIVNG